MGTHDKLKFVGQNLAEATGVEPAHDERGDLVPRPRDCHTVRRRLLRESFVLLPAAPAPVFLAGTPGFEPRKAGLEADGLPISLRPKEIAD